MWKLAFDRFEYGSDTPVYLAFGAIDAATGAFDPQIVTGALAFERQRKATGEQGNAPNPEPLTVGKSKVVSIESTKAYGITVDRLLLNGEPVIFADDDQLIVSVKIKPAATEFALQCRVKIVLRPIIAPPPAVYSLIGLSDHSARPLLHATAPLPQTIEFPSLANDLALGNVRRRALFFWTSSMLVVNAPTSATLVKLDRAGGGQLPDSDDDLETIAWP